MTTRLKKPDITKDTAACGGPYGGLEFETIENLIRSGDQLQNRLGKFLRKQGLTLPQFNVLRILHLEGRRLPCLTIAQKMTQVVPAITGIIDRLESSGWVQRDRCDTDRRVIYVRLTDEGCALLTRLLEPYASFQRTLIGNLSESELATLSDLLQKARVHANEEVV